MNDHHKHQRVVKQEFSRQAEHISSAPSFTDQDTIEGIVNAVGATYQDRVLDVACGTGIVVFSLAKTAKEVVGLDITGEMLQQARRQRHDLGVTNVHFELGEAESLPFEDNAFNASVCRMSIHHFGDPALVLKEMVRVTCPGGRVVLADIVSTSQAHHAELHNAIERLRDPSHIRMLSQDELIQLVTASGLSVLSTDSWEKRRHFEEWAQVLNSPERTDPLHTLLRELAQKGLDVGMGLSLDESGEVHFTHHWLLVVAEVPKS